MFPIIKDGFRKEWHVKPIKKKVLRFGEQNAVADSEGSKQNPQTAGRE